MCAPWLSPDDESTPVGAVFSVTPPLRHWHYEIGAVGTLLDGAVGYPSCNDNPAVVQKVRTTGFTVPIGYPAELWGSGRVKAESWAVPRSGRGWVREGWGVLLCRARRRKGGLGVLV
ncbi:hypothetical protein Aple_038140 [Acrocarpospora pleiomorpha]|uniref:Uncharacterized protein n=1 Tax=Acrocarpospora pleiomorpha TaxID=90975 RepID=A0A5M3XRC2_9ACTN|nr:hypothetical protein Aple_038140 [Acrocarpospora pleiomorpha]